MLWQRLQFHSSLERKSGSVVTKRSHPLRTAYRSAKPPDFNESKKLFVHYFRQHRRISAKVAVVVVYRAGNKQDVIVANQWDVLPALLQLGAHGWVACAILLPPSLAGRNPFQLATLHGRFDLPNSVPLYLLRIAVGH